MKKTRIAFLLTALFLTAITLTGCSNPIIVSSAKATQAISENTNNQAMVGVTKANNDGTYSLEFTLPEKNVTQASRSLVNYESSAALQAAINWYQLVLVDNDTPDQIWASATDSLSGILCVVVKPGTTYHLLLLHGHKNNPADENETPILLGSGYIKYKIQAENAALIIIRMAPVLIEATIAKANESSALWSMTRNIAWVKNERFDVTIKLRSRTATQDGETVPHGNALWPLLLAQARADTLVWDTFKADMPAAITDKDSPQYVSTNGGTEGAPREGVYWTYNGENTTIPGMPNTLTLLEGVKPETGIVAAYYSIGNDPDSAVASRSRADSATTQTTSGGVTTGTLKYAGFDSLNTFSEPMDYGKFSFALTYIPFGIRDDTKWRTAGASRWTIGGDVYLYRESDSTRIASFDLYNANSEKLSLSTDITHENDQNGDPNLITIVVPLGTPRITTGFTQISLESPASMEISPPSGTLPANFEPADPVAGTNSVAGVTYTVYPKGQTKDSPSARIYNVVLKRSDTSQGQPNPEAPLKLDLDPSALQGTVSLGTKAGEFKVSGTGAVGTPIYTLVVDTGTTNGIRNDRDNGKFTINGANLVVNAELSPGDYYIVAKVTMDGGKEATQAFIIEVSQSTPQPEASLKLDLTPETLKETAPATTKAGVFSVSGTPSVVGTPVYTLVADTGTTNGIRNDRDNGKFKISGADLLVGASPLSPGTYYIVAKVVTMVDGGSSPAEVTRAFTIEVRDKASANTGWGS